MDSADEAGGEAVFTSDGLPSLAAPLPPPPLPSIGDGATGAGGKDDGGGDAVVEEESDPRAAFESFGDAGVGWLSNNPNAASSAGWEDPRRRLFQLKKEVDELEASLAEENEKGGTDDGNHHAAALELQARLAELGTGDSSALAAMLRGRQEDLSRVIARDLENYGEKKDGLATDLEKMSLGESKEGGGDGKIVYELYRANNLAPDAAKSVPREVALEERLRRLERAVGSSAAAAGEQQSILERVDAAERLAREVDAKTVEKLAAKAKVARADLEAAARARAKLASKSGGAASGGKEDAKTIAALHAQMVELEGISAHLPALTVRLAELADLHATAADFATRLDAAEAVAARSEGALTSVEEALKAMEAGWKGNLEAVERNVKKLDELLAKQSP